MKRNLTLFAIICAVSAWADTWTDPDTGITWNYSVSYAVDPPGTAAIGGELGPAAAIATTTSGDVAIPSEINGHPLTSIGNGAFSGCSALTGVTIPDSVTRIRLNAFANCSGISHVTIGSGVTNIVSGAFTGCSSLMAFAVADGNPSYTAAGGLLLSKSGETLVHGVNGDVAIPDSVKSIGESAFRGYTGLSSVTIPDSVASIANYVFSDCTGLESVTIGTGVTSIELQAFQNCSNVRNATKKKKKCEIPFANVTNLVISPGTKAIQERAFSDCTSLVSVAMPDSMTSIVDYAFYGCTALASVTIPD